MADTQVYEKNLGAKSANSIGTSDYVRVVGSDNNSYKQPMNDIGKTILEKYTGSTLAGSAQSAKSAIDALNSNTYQFKNATFLENGSDLNQYYTVGNYACKTNSSASTLLNCPTTKGFTMKVEWATGNGNPRQTIREFDTGVMYTRYTSKFDGTGWSTWIKLPTRDEVDALNSNSIVGRNSTFSGDINTLKTPGYWYCTSSATNIPEGFTAVHLFVSTVGARVIQTAYQFGGNQMAVRTSADSGSTWGTWYKYAKQSDIDALNSNTWKKQAATYTSPIDADDYTTPGFYHVGISTNSPLGTSAFYGTLIVYSGGSGQCQQIATSAQSGYMYMRGRNNSSNAWSAWDRLARQADVDTLNSNSTDILHRLTGWGAYNTSVRNLDATPTESMCGIWWTNMGDSGVTGTKPISSGQGILILLRQSTTAYRQVYIGCTSASTGGIWCRHYSTSSNVWETSWTAITTFG